MVDLERIRKSFEVGSPLAQGMALHKINELTEQMAAKDAELASHTSALAEKDARIAELEAALKRLEGDSLDAMIEVIGEGPEFKRYNQGKSAMREWFLRRVNSMISGGSPDA